MRLIQFTFFFTLLFLFSFSNIVQGASDISLSIQPSVIRLNLDKQYTTITVPYRVWNSGNTESLFTLIPVNISEFTNFTTINFTLKAHTTRTENYTEIPIVFKVNTSFSNKTVNGGLILKSFPSGEGMVAIVPQVFAQIKITQTDVKTGEPAYTFFPPSNNTNTGTVIPAGEQSFFSRYKVAIGILAGIILIIVVFLLYRWMIGGM